jgi:cytochrome c peroxidase
MRARWWPGVALAVTICGSVSAFQPLRVPLGLDAYMPVPEDNNLSPAKVALGRRLFFDTRISADGRVACATCHDAARAFTDGRARSVGVFGRTGTRNAPALINRGYGAAFFWDGRAPSLEAQVLDPFDNPDELGIGRDAVVAFLAADAAYVRAFEAAFGRPITTRNLGRTLASYVRSILAGDSRVDRFTSGDTAVLTVEEREGLRVFRGKGNCVSCHFGPTFTDERFHNTGVAWRSGTVTDDGRFMASGRPEDRGAFKTPTLREIARTAPYMHDGSVATLADVIDFYDRGGIANPHRDPELRPLQLTAGEKQALEAFLRALSGIVQDGPAGLTRGPERR